MDETGFMCLLFFIVFVCGILAGLVIRNMFQGFEESKKKPPNGSVGEDFRNATT